VVLRSIRKLILRTAISVILLVTLVAVLAYFFPQKFLTVDSGDVSADVLIVLGGGLHERPARAAELFKQQAAPRIILTGEGDDSFNRHVLLANGVPANVIEIENKSETTQENALFTIKLLRAENVHSAILVTSWYHSRRALKTFEHYAPGITFYSRPSYFGFIRADWKTHNTQRSMRLEFLKIPGYWLRYGVNPL
jgi:uncharacterized SAM-binding protein YcdF (DUF218 family)